MFDSLVDQCLTTLKTYKKLKEVILKDNFIYGLLQLAKLEVLISMRVIIVAPQSEVDQYRQQPHLQLPLSVTVPGLQVSPAHSSQRQGCERIRS